MSEQIISESLKQGPFFALLMAVGYVFYRFLDRTYTDHQAIIVSLQDTFKQSISEITNSIGSRLDRIEETLEVKAKRKTV